MIEKAKYEFDYQWKNLDSVNLNYSEERITELLFFTGLTSDFFINKKVLDAGCGNGRYTYALQKLGADVKSIDISIEAVNRTKQINSNTEQKSILDCTNEKYDFILSYGVLHHLQYPIIGFNHLSNLINKGGILHIMVYDTRGQVKYKNYRKQFKRLSLNKKIELCKQLTEKFGDIHGWFDCLNPKYNYSFTSTQIINLFEMNGFTNVRIITEHNINANGIKL